MIMNQDSTTFALKINNLTKRYSKKQEPAVYDASFNVARGSFHGFIGKNGSGKTTTIKSIIGAYHQYSGKISIFGISNNLEIAKSKIGYIPENSLFPSGFNVFSYLYNMARLSNLKSVEAKIKVNAKIREFELGSLVAKDPNKLSSGQKKKVLLIQALLHEPEILIMDEPAANLDPSSRLYFFGQLQKLVQQGKTIFISSHVLSELNKYIDAFTLIDAGKIIYSGKIAAFNQDNQDKWKIVVDDFALAKKVLTAEKINFEVKDNFFIVNAKKPQIKLITKALSEKVLVKTAQKYQVELEEMFLSLTNKKDKNA